MEILLRIKTILQQIKFIPKVIRYIFNTFLTSSNDISNKYLNYHYYYILISQFNPENHIKFGVNVCDQILSMELRPSNKQRKGRDNDCLKEKKGNRNRLVYCCKQYLNHLAFNTKERALNLCSYRVLLLSDEFAEFIFKNDDRGKALNILI